MTGSVTTLTGDCSREVIVFGTTLVDECDLRVNIRKDSFARNRNGISYGKVLGVDTLHIHSRCGT